MCYSSGRIACGSGLAIPRSWSGLSVWFFGYARTGNSACYRRGTGLLLFEGLVSLRLVQKSQSKAETSEWLRRVGNYQVSCAGQYGKCGNRERGKIDVEGFTLMRLGAGGRTKSRGIP